MKRNSFAPSPEYIAKLQQAIRVSHRANAIHEATWMGAVELHGELWSGSVEVFRVGRGEKMERVFAWSKVTGGQLHCFVVAAQKGICTPEDAVRSVLKAEHDVATAATAVE